MLLSEAQRAFDLSMIGETAPATRRWYSQRVGSVVKFLGDVEVTRVTTDDLRRWRASLVERDRRWVDHPGRPEAEGGLSPWTIHGHVRAVRRFFRWLVEEKVIKVSPAARLKLPRLPKELPKAISPDDLALLLEAVKSDPRDHAIVCFLADTGCRVGGMAGLGLTDLDLKSGRALVREKGRGGWKSRVVYFNSRTRGALSSWLNVRPEVATDAVFLSKTRGTALTTGGIYQVLKRLAKQANIEGRFNPHSFRHAWAREALTNGANLADVSQVLGHDDVSVTVRFYGLWSDKELKKRHSRFSPLADVSVGETPESV